MKNAEIVKRPYHLREDGGIRRGRNESAVKTFLVTIEFACDRLMDYPTPREQFFHAIGHAENRDYHKISAKELEEAEARE